MGWSVRRRRSWRTAINQDTLLWLGPRDRGGIQKHFESFFRRTVEVDADVFLATASSTLEEKNFRAELAKGQGNFAPEGGCLPVQACMTPAAFKRLAAHQQKYAEMAQKPACFVADLSRNCDSRSRCGSILPAACASSVFFSLTKDRFFTPSDMLIAHGWPVNSESEFADLMPFDRSKLSTCQERMLLGNSMHLAQVGAVFLYVTSHVLRREVAMAMCPIPWTTAEAAAALRDSASAVGSAAEAGDREDDGSVTCVMAGTHRGHLAIRLAGTTVQPDEPVGESGCRLGTAPSPVFGIFDGATGPRASHALDLDRNANDRKASACLSHLPGCSGTSVYTRPGRSTGSSRGNRRVSAGTGARRWRDGRDGCASSGQRRGPRRTPRQRRRTTTRRRAP